MRLFANLADYLPRGARGGAARIQLAAGATVGDLLRSLGVPPELPRLVLIDGRDAMLDDPLRPGDVVTILPPLVGGAPPGA